MDDQTQTSQPPAIEPVEAVPKPTEEILTAAETNEQPEARPEEQPLSEVERKIELADAMEKEATARDVELLRLEAETLVDEILAQGKDFGEGSQLRMFLDGTQQRAGFETHLRTDEAKKYYGNARQGLELLLAKQPPFFETSKAITESGYQNAEREILVGVTLLMLKGMATGEILEQVMTGIRVDETKYPDSAAHFSYKNREMVFYKDTFKIPVENGKPNPDRYDQSQLVFHEYAHAMMRYLVNLKEFRGQEAPRGRPPLHPDEQRNIRNLLRGNPDKVGLLKTPHMAALLKERDQKAGDPNFRRSLVNEDFAEMSRLAMSSKDLATMFKQVLRQSYLWKSQDFQAAGFASAEQFRPLAQQFFERTGDEKQGGETPRFIEQFIGISKMTEQQKEAALHAIDQFVAANVPEPMQGAMEDSLRHAVHMFDRVQTLKDHGHIKQLIDDETDDEDEEELELAEDTISDGLPIATRSTDKNGSEPPITMKDVAKFFQILFKG